MDRRTVAAIVLSLGIYYAWLAFRGKPEVDPADDLAEATPGSPAPETTGSGTAPVVSVPPPPTEDLPFQEVPFSACGVTGKVSNDGALHDLVLDGEKGAYHVTPIYSWVVGKVTGSIPGSWKPYGDDPGPAQVVSVGGAAFLSGTGPGPAQPGPRRQLTVAGPGDVTLTGQSGGLVVEQRLVEHREGDVCTVDQTIRWKNPTGTPWSGPVWTAVLDHSSKAIDRYSSVQQPTALVDDDLIYGGALGAGCIRQGTQLSDESGPIPLEGPVSWYGVSGRYFGIYVVPDDGTPGSLRFERVGTGDAALDGPVLAADVTVPAQGELSWHSRAFVGENHLAALGAVDPDLERVVDLGWFAFFGRPLVWLLGVFHGLTASWGLSIILLTVLVKVVFFPMTHRAMKSAQKMQEIQPELTRIREQYADNPTEMNRLVLEVMTTNQVNPAMGCLPMLVQMPVFFALYQALLTNVEFYQQDFLYLHDLSSPDPYIVLPLSVTFLMWLQQQFTTPPANMEPAQQAILKWMPLMFGLFFFASPSGLGVYMLVNMSLSIFQQWIIKRSLGGKSVAAAPVPF